MIEFARRKILTIIALLYFYNAIIFFASNFTEVTDYAAVVRFLDFNSDDTTIEVPVTIVPNDVIEPTENFFAVLNVTSPDSDNIVLGRNTAQITIEDDDCKQLNTLYTCWWCDYAIFMDFPAVTIGIVGENMVVREGEANPRFNIMVMSGQLGGNVTLVYSTYSINATGTLYTKI